MTRIWKIGAIAIAILLTFFLFAGRPLLHLLTELWWFEAVGFDEVFWTRISWQVGLWLLTLVAFLAILGGNVWLCRTFVGRHDIPQPLIRRLSRQEFFLYRLMLVVAIVAISLVAATLSVPAWETLLKALNATSFERADPLFGLDLSFYIFRLPLLEGVLQWLSGLMLCSLLLVVPIYILEGDIDPQRDWRAMVSRPAKFHISVLLVAIAIILSCNFWLQRFELLYSPEGVVFGAGYTDINARLPINSLASILTAMLAALLSVSLWMRRLTLPLGAILVYSLILVLANFYPPMMQRFLVEPNELAKERPYVAHNIELTRAAYGLAEVDRRDFPVETALDRDTLDRNEPTIANIRLWDYRPLLDTYRQLQEIRPYYRFLDVDVDRYTFGDRYQQVMLATREMDSSRLGANAQTWVNRHLNYTHGFGLVMSPVTEVTANGLPAPIVKDIPPIASVPLDIDQPRVYYGEANLPYIFTGATADEFDYPLGEDNATNRYDGLGGVSLSPWYRRWTYALDLGSWNLFASNSLNAQSRIHYHRHIRDRLEQVAPFLRYDSDPYTVVSDGRLKWIVDAYTVSNRYPYSEPIANSANAGAIRQAGNISRLFRERTNYIRNSVKAVVDAYDGSLQFVVVDESDPLLSTYRTIFPTLFQSLDSVSEDLRSHFRYPQDLFKIQSQMYLSYHVSDPAVFYNGEDLWSFPKEVFRTGEQLLQPYYVIMRLPEEESEEFILIWPFTPLGKGNMVAWMAARSDGEFAGKLLLYEFPRQELIFGPRQIEARIDQTPEISEQLTLWGQQGSRVIRGDLLVIPVERSLLYVEPIFLSAEEQALPELQRVIVVYDDRIAMANRLPEALEQIFGSSTAATEEARGDRAITAAIDGQPLDASIREAILEALDIHQRALSAQQQLDWSEYGRQQERLGELLEQLVEGTADGTVPLESQLDETTSELLESELDAVLDLALPSDGSDSADTGAESGSESP